MDNTDPPFVNLPPANGDPELDPKYNSLILYHSASVQDLLKLISHKYFYSQFIMYTGQFTLSAPLSWSRVQYNDTGFH